MITNVDLIPAGKGRFLVTVDDTVVFSKEDIGRHANPGEVAGLVEELIGPRTFEG